VLYVSWAGRSPRDNQQQPPSVLVSQLRDYLAAGWGAHVVAQRTTEHPLQPFSRKYFEPQADKPAAQRLVTYAGEWRAAHVERAPIEPARTGQPQGDVAALADVPLDKAGPPLRLTIADLAAFVRNPVKAFFRRRLQVAFDELDEATQDDEAFGSAGLERWALLDEVLLASRRQLDGARQAGTADLANAADTAAPADVAAVVHAQLARLKRAGQLPVAGPGRLAEDELRQTLLPMVAHWQAARDAHPQARDPLALQLADPQDPGLVFDDVLTGLRADAAGGPAVWIELQASKVADVGKTRSRIVTLRADKLVAAWLRCLAAAACGQPTRGIVIGAGAAAVVEPPPQQQEAAAQLVALLRACRAGLCGSQPLPTAVRTGLAWLDDPATAEPAYDGSGFGSTPGEGSEACLARLYPDYATLSAQPGFAAASARLYAPYAAWLAHHVRVESLPEESAGAATTASQPAGSDHG
jgi:exodeoxyribonuclease V gamma subunit